MQNAYNSGEGSNVLHAAQRISTYHANFLEPSSSNNSLLTLSLINSYEDGFESDVIKNIDSANTRIEEQTKRVQSILEQLENPSAEVVLADYAKVFETEEIKCTKAANRWFNFGLTYLCLFIAFVILSINFEWFPSTLALKTTTGNIVKSIEIIHVPILVTKVLVFSLAIYLIIFCFKQYSIHKNLAFINQQRKNAFGSLNLFSAAIGETDKEAKRILLTSLAKTLHENVSSGFLSSSKVETPSVSNTLDIGKALTGN